jgi:hypothetical protein
MRGLESVVLCSFVAVYPLDFRDNAWGLFGLLERRIGRWRICSGCIRGNWRFEDRRTEEQREQRVHLGRCGIACASRRSGHGVQR